MKEHLNEPVPFVSVIVPVYNDPQGISETLSSLEQQDYPRDKWEVIVIDNNSSDETRQIAHSFIPHLPGMQVVSETRRGSYAARNTGIGLARGEIIAFVDADMVMNNNWICTGVKDIIRGDADYVGCRVDIFTRGNPPSVCEIYNQRTGFPVKEYMERFGFAGAGNIFVRKNVFESIGMFDQRMISGGDYEFGTRVKDAGFKMFYSSHNCMEHPARGTMTSLLKKSVRSAKGYVDLRVLYPERFGRITPYSLMVSFIAIPITVPKSFRELSFMDKLRILGIQLLGHYTTAVSRLAHYINLTYLARDKRCRQE